MKGNILRMEDLKVENTIDMKPLKEQYLEQEMSQEQLLKLQSAMSRAKAENRRDRIRKQAVRYASTAAALVAAFVILPNTSATVAHAMGQIPVIGGLVKMVTFRDYQYEDESHRADITVPELKVELLENWQAQDAQLQENLDKTTEQINAEIKQIADDLIGQFTKYVNEDMGYQDISVKGEILATTEEYLTLKLLCYQAEASGYQWNYYYTIDLRTGERLQLKDIFAEGADYITPISESIKKQMREQMAADEMVRYWLEDEIGELNFKGITEETSFYLNEKGNVVIGFDEGEVAPMYMGAVEFEIPTEALSEIRK